MRRAPLLPVLVLALILAALAAPPAAEAQITSSGPCPSALAFPLNAGATCFRTDTGAQFIWNGTAWIQVVLVGGAGAQATDYQLFLNAVDVCYGSTANFVKTRIATGNWVLQDTTAETLNWECSFGFPSRTTVGKGFQITGVSIVLSVTGAALTTHTFQGMQTATYANNVATAVAAYGGAVTCALPTATQANPYLVVCTVPTPAFMNTANAQVTIDAQAVIAAGGTYQLAGIIVSYTEIPL